MHKYKPMDELLAQIPSGATLMVGGFLGCGSPHGLLQALADSGKGGFTVICNDGGILNGPDGSSHYGVAKLIHNGQVSHLIASHVGLNPEVAQQVNDGALKLTLIPQGSLAEMVRAGGAGLGGVLTPTGVGTMVEENPDFVAGRQTLNGRDYLLMYPLHADVALLSAYHADPTGNLWYRGTARNFNPLMATAADLVLVQVDQPVDYGAIAPENIATPGAYVDYMTTGGSLHGG